MAEQQIKRKHKNLAIFVPHEGCPNQCSFCDQKKISGAQCPPTPTEVTTLCHTFLPKEGQLQAQDYEIAFFGGSFTAIEPAYMESLLKAAYPFVKNKRANGIRISTRPDAIDKPKLEILKQYGVTSIELGAQSMQDEVLRKNLRGHTVQAVITACNLIKEYGFSLGLQMMTGLYGQADYMEYALDTTRQFIALKPDTVRIYPTLILKDTLLADFYAQGAYLPASLKESVAICAKISCMFEEKGIKVIKLGLHADPSLEKALVAGPYHPAFKELVQSFIYLEKFKKDFNTLPKGRYHIAVSPQNLSQGMGQKKANIYALAQMGYNVNFIADNSLLSGQYKIILSEEQ